MPLEVFTHSCQTDKVVSRTVYTFCVFTVFFSKSENVTFLRFLSCCTRFLEHCTQLERHAATMRAVSTVTIATCYQCASGTTRCGPHGRPVLGGTLPCHPPRQRDQAGEAARALCLRATRYFRRCPGRTCRYPGRRPASIAATRGAGARRFKRV